MRQVGYLQRLQVYREPRSTEHKKTLKMEIHYLFLSVRRGQTDGRTDGFASVVTFLEASGRCDSHFTPNAPPKHTRILCTASPLSVKETAKGWVFILIFRNMI
jgi:hypothetical protein